jgi:hypothetical protein
MKTENEFFHKVALGMAGCQRVEQYLKLYISEAYAFTKECINGRMEFRFSGKDVENSSLERLIEIFSKFLDDPVLVKELRRFKDERNFLSHTAITHSYDYGGDYSELMAIYLEPRLMQIEKHAQSLVDRIHQHHGNLLCERYFENLDEVK